MKRAPCTPGIVALASAALVPLALPATGRASAGADSWADAVVSFDQGEGANEDFAEPLTTLGPPERFTGEQFPPFQQVVSVFSPPFGTDEIVSLGRGGVLVVRFDEPVTDDPDNPFGIDLLVFGNAGFIDTFPFTETVIGLFGADGGVIELSADGEHWCAVPDAAADALFPTAGYLDSGAYDQERGEVETDFTRPVDPALTLEDFLGLRNPEVLTLYRGAGGGTGIDLAACGLQAVRFVRIRNPVDAVTDVEIDAFSDVAPRRPGDATGDLIVDFADVLAVLAGWGACPDPPLVCPADLDDSGTVDFADVLLVLTHWSR